MNAIQWLLVAVAIYGTGAVLALFLNRAGRAALILSGLSGMAGSACGLAAAIVGLVEGRAALDVALPLPFGDLGLRLDGLATLMVGMISLLGLVVSLYAMSSLEAHAQRNPGVIGLSTNLFLGLMLLVVSVANAFYFLIFWEMMTLVSYFLVVVDQKPESVRAGYLYLLVAQAGGALIMLAFLIYYLHAGSFSFDAFRATALPPTLRGLVFLMMFVGFGAKAGMVPLHFWMPGAYASAPGHAAALMSSVMKKTALYGFLRFCVDLPGGADLWAALLVLLFGALSAFFGALFALREHDLKRMLAYSSVENVGIILLGIGTGMIGLATGRPVVTLLGFLAALYHMLNHTFFKALLFLGAGAIELRAQTADLNRLGGLGRRMPWTAAAFLVGALALAAIPPLNGFVSEWLTYQSFFAASGSLVFTVHALLPLCAAILALVGALAVMIAVKAYGGAFSGPARSPAADAAGEVPGAMLSAMALLAIACLLLGLGAPLVAPYLTDVAASMLDLPAMEVASGLWNFPPRAGEVALSMPVAAALLLVLLAVPWLVVLLYGGRRAGRRVVADPWACGYGYAPSMSVAAGSFDQPVASTFSTLYWLRALARRPLEAVAGWAGRAREWIRSAEPVLERVVRQPLVRAVEWGGQAIQVLQRGDIRLYCLYIVLTLAILLVVLFR